MLKARTKNLFDLNKYEFTNGKSLAVATGLPVTYSGTLRGATLKPIDVSAYGQVTFSLTALDGFNGIIYSTFNGDTLVERTAATVGNTSVTINTTNVTKIYLCWYSNDSSYSATDVAKEVMLVEGSTVPSSYIPYLSEVHELYKNNNGTAEYIGEAYKNKTVANQLVQDGDFAATTNWRSDKVSSFTISNNIASFTANGANGKIYQYINVVAQHKYLYLVDILGTNTSVKYSMNIGGTVQDYSIDNLSSWKTYSSIETCAETMKGYVRILDTRASDWDEVKVKNVMFFDLTQMFGAGYEPTTVEDAKTRIAKVFGYTADYYPYTTSAEIGGYEHIFSAGWDTTVAAAGSVATLTDARAKDMSDYNIAGQSAQDNYRVGVKTGNPVTISDGKASELGYYEIQGNSEPEDFPETFAKLEYIQGSGTQYIDTEFTPNQDTSVEIDFKYNTVPTSSNSGLFGTFTSTNNRYETFYSTAKISLEYGFGTAYSTTSSLRDIDTNRHKIYQNKANFYFDGTLDYTSPSTVSFTASYPMWIGAFNFQGGLSSSYPAFSGNIYGFKVWDDETLVRDLIPVKRKADGALGLYDLANTKNLFDYTAVNTSNGYISDTYLDSTGTAVADSAYSTSEYIQVQPNTTYYYAIDGIGVTSPLHNAPRPAFYNKDKTYLSSVATAIGYGRSFTTPNGCYYVRLPIYKLHKSGAMFSLGATEPAAYERYPFYTNSGTGTFTGGSIDSIAINNVGDKTENLFDKDAAVLGTISSTTGVIDTTATYRIASDLISVSAGDILQGAGTFVKSGETTELTANFIKAYYDSSKTFISSSRSTVNFPLTIPSGAEYVRFELYNTSAVVGETIDKDKTKVTVVKSSTAPTDYIPYGYRIPISATGKNKFNYLSTRIANANASFNTTTKEITLLSGFNGTSDFNISNFIIEDGVSYSYDLYLSSNTANTNRLSVILRNEDATISKELRFTTNATDLVYTGSITGDGTNMSRLQLWASSSSALNGDIVFKLQIRKTNDTSAYESYQEPVSGTIYDDAQLCRIYDGAKIDLGTLNWTYQDSSGNFYVDNAIPSRYQSSTLPYCPAYCDMYAQNTTQSMSGVYSLTQDKTFSFQYSESAVAVMGRIIIRDTRFTDAADFKAAMSGVYLYYQLASDSVWYQPYWDIINSDGARTNQIIKIDLGSLYWGTTPYGGYSTYTTPNALSPLMVSDSSGSNISPMLCDCYKAGNWSAIRYDTAENYTIAIHPDGNGIWIRNEDFNDDTLYPTGQDKVDAFKAAMSGKYLYAVLRTKTTETVEVPTLSISAQTNIIQTDTEVVPNLEIEYYKATTATSEGSDIIAPTPRYASEIQSLGTKTDNLFPYTNFGNGITGTGYVTTNNHDGSFTIVGDGTSTIVNNFPGSQFTLPAGTYTLKGSESGLNFYVVLSYAGTSGNIYIYNNYGNYTFTLTSETSIRPYIQGKAAVNGTFTTSPYLVAGSTAPTTFEPYGYKIPVVRRCDCGVVDLGDLDWSYTPDTNPYFRVRINNAKSYTTAETANIFADGFTVTPTSIVEKADKRISSAGSYIYISYRSCTDVETLKAAVAGTKLYYQRTTDTSWTAPVKTNVYLAEPLRKNGDYVDQIDFSDGKVYRNVSENITPLSTHTWAKNSDSPDGNYISFYSQNAGLWSGAYNSFFCNYFNCARWSTIQNINGDYCWSATSSAGFRIHKDNLVGYLPSMTDEQKITLFKNWLDEINGSDIPIIVNKPLDATVEETITLPTLSTAKGTNYIEIDTELEPSAASFTYRKKTK